MPASSAIASYGVTLTRAGNAIAELLTVGSFKISRDTIEATNHGSPNQYREYIAGLKDGGELSFEANSIGGDTLGQQGLITDLENGTLQAFILTLPTAITETCTFSGLVTSVEVGDFTIDGKVSFKATIKVSGKPVWAVTGSANLTTLTGIEENAGTALTFTPAFAGAKKSYNIAVNTASTWVKFTPTLAGATISIYNGTTSQDVLSGAQSGTIAIGAAAASPLELTLYVKETGKVPNTYTVNVYRP